MIENRKIQPKTLQVPQVILPIRLLSPCLIYNINQKLGRISHKTSQEHTTLKIGFKSAPKRPRTHTPNTHTDKLLYFLFFFYKNIGYFVGSWAQQVSWPFLFGMCVCVFARNSPEIYPNFREEIRFGCCILSGAIKRL